MLHKTKAISDVFPALSEQHTTCISNNTNPLPYFFKAKNAHNYCIGMAKEKEVTKKEVDDKWKESIIDIRGVESSKGGGLDRVISSALKHPKTFTHSANIVMTDRASTVTALSSASRSKIEKN